MSNKTKISYRTLGTLESTGKRYFIRDTELAGFGIEVSATGRTSYFVETRHNSKKSPVRKQIAPVELIDLDEARKQARSWLLQANQGKDIRHLQDQDEVIPDTLWDAVLHHAKEKRHLLAASTLADYQKTFVNALSDWKGLPTTQLSRSMVKDRYLLLRDSKSASYCNKVFRNLQAVLSYSGVSPNPCSILRDKKLKGKPVARERYLSGNEIHHILQHHKTFKPKVLRLVIFIMLTGVRKMEALRLTWGDIQQDHVVFRDTKNGKAHAIPAVGMIKEMLGKRTADNELVFGYTENVFRRDFDRAKEVLKFKDKWTLHDLRRTFSEHMNLIGYSAKDIGVAINHTPIGVTQTHYLSGQLAKESLLISMMTDLQKQYLYYQHEHDGGSIQKVPTRWRPEGSEMMELEKSIDFPRPDPSEDTGDW
jgi:integrase